MNEWKKRQIKRFYFILLHKRAACLAAFHLPVRCYIAHYIGFNLRCIYRRRRGGQRGKWGKTLLRFSITFPANGPLAEQRLWRRLAFILCYLLLPLLFHQPLQTEELQLPGDRGRSSSLVSGSSSSDSVLRCAERCVDSTQRLQDAVVYLKQGFSTFCNFTPTSDC